MVGAPTRTVSGFESRSLLVSGMLQGTRTETTQTSSPWWKSVGSRAGVFGSQARNERAERCLSS